ncbi:hypothetical protein AAFF_G00114110 [Aldrovandia affinis]|uniref:Uncharacterized protein n=1 Tax=Aldrovandia affinis TaxID=143900 RepID=A0AAD7RT25_9TELE|nr:hypothetical protein AAFF_G00114110 [Aldrovandia affinis]
MGRKLKAHLDLLYPDERARVEQKPLQPKAHPDQQARQRLFEVGDRGVRSALIQTGPVSYVIRLEGGRQVRRPQDHVHHRAVGNAELEWPSVADLLRAGDGETEQTLDVSQREGRQRALQRTVLPQAWRSSKPTLLRCWRVDNEPYVVQLAALNTPGGHVT